MNYYNKYSTYLKDSYGEKVYKLPINLPVTCPNRIQDSGCTFCSEKGTGFEAMCHTETVKEQLTKTKEHISKKYNAHKFIAYFQNYTNTFMPIEEFESYIKEACEIDDIVEISVSTRPDCIQEPYLKVLKTVCEQHKIKCTIELGLQTVNYHTLNTINRGHTLAEFIDAVLQIKPFDFTICAHVILNLPGDNMVDIIETAKILSSLKVNIVKCHSLYIAKETVMSKQYDEGSIEICSKLEYLNRLVSFIEYISPDIIIERLFSRIPKEDMTFSNWNTSWWKLQDEFEALMEENQSFQGKSFHYLNGAGLRYLPRR